MIKKIVYEEPIMTFIRIEMQDVITMSGGEEGDITQNKGTYDELFKNTF